MADDLRLATWKTLQRLTGEHVTPDGLSRILSEVAAGVATLDELNEEQASKLSDTLAPLPGLRQMLWEGCVASIESINSSLPKGVVRLDAQATADMIVPHQLDRLAHLLVQQSHS